MPWLRWLLIVWSVLMVLYGIAIMVRPQRHGSRLSFIRGLGAVIVVIGLFLLADHLHLI